MVFTYPVLIHEDSDGVWAEWPDMPGCHTCNDTVEEILADVVEAQGLHLEGLIEMDGVAPKPTDIKTLRNLPENVFATLVRTDVDLARNTKAVKKTLTIPAWLNELALKKGVNFSQVLQEALVRKTVMA